MARRNLTKNTNGNEYQNTNPFVNQANQNYNNNSTRQSYPGFTDPFDSSNRLDDGSFDFENRSSYPSSSTSTSSIANQYGRPFTVGNGLSSSNGSSGSHLLQGQNDYNLLLLPNLQHQQLQAAENDKSSSLLNSNINNIKVDVPYDYDRYPKIIGRVSSSNSLNNTSNTAPYQSETPSISSNSFNKNVNNTLNSSYNNMIDFSPFGGYPASSFPLNIDEKEPDDYLHNPDPVHDVIYEKNRFWNDLKTADRKSFGGILGFLFLIAAAVAVFVVVPTLTYSGVTTHSPPQEYEILSHYSYPLLSAIRTSLIDPDTPQDALKMKAKDGSNWSLVFSDEFNIMGRTFYEGDDQFWTAPDLHYDATKDLEWYDPDAATTSNGTLNLQMDAFKNHDLFYRSGMVQSWNQLCFTQGKLVISARLANKGTVSGLWPGIWTMGNLGRPGYLASTEGIWPYSYDSCDSGITPNQSSPDGISYLPGQRLNKCTCPGESHPNRGVGRGAPEIDVIEAEISTDATGNRENLGVASQSLQLAPMDIWYYPDLDYLEIYNTSITTMNTYTGGPFQQALSGTTTLNKTWYELGGNGVHNFQTYGYEYLNDKDNGYLRWFVGDNPTLTVYPQALHPNGNVGWRPLSREPMSIVMNLGVSNNWVYIDWPSLSFPSTFRIDYVRLYQPPNQINVGCDPAGFPTSDYIEQHINVYQNANLTSFEDGGYSFPKHSLIGC